MAAFHDEVDRALHDLGELVERACSPAPANRTQIATHAKELLEHRAAIHKQERLVASLRSDLAVRSQWIARSDDKLRALGGELADVRKRLDDVAKQAADGEKEAACAGDVAARALDDKELAVRRGEGALRRLQRRHERELDKRDREHDAEREARAGELADLRACVSRESRDLAGVRADLAASVAAHARDLTSAKKMREQALAEQEREHAERARDQAGVDAKAIAAREHAHADELALVRAAAALTVEMHLRETEQAEQSLASARARHEREADSLRLQLTSLREAAAAEQRLAQHAMALHTRAGAELARVRGALEAAELARNAALADLEQHRARGGDRPSDHSGVRVASGHYEEDEEDVDTHDDGMTDRMRAC